MATPSGMTGAFSGLTGLADAFKDFVASVKAAFAPLADLGTATASAMSAVASGVATVGSAIGSTLAPALAAAGAAAVAMGGAVASAVSAAFAPFRPALAAIRSVISDFASAGADLVRAGLATAGAAVSQFAGSIAGLIGPPLQYAATLIGYLAEEAKQAFGDMTSWIGAKLGAATAAVQNWPIVGAVVTALGKVGAAVGSTVAATVSAALASLGPVAGAAGAALGAFGSALGKLPAALVAVGGVAVKAVGLFGEFVGAGARLAGAVAGVAASMAQAGASLLRMPLNVLDTGISAINANVARFVQLASPAHFQLFTRAVDDLMASIGYALIPVMQQFTAMVRSVGSAIFGTSAAGQKLIAAIAAGTVGLIAFGAAFALVQTVMTGGLMPIIGAVVGALGGMAVATGMLQPLLASLSSTLSGVMDAVGVALESVSAQVTNMLPAIAGAMGHVAGMIGYLAGAFDRMGPAIGALMDVAFEVMKAFQPLQDLYLTAVVEGVVLLAAGFRALAPAIIVVVQAVGSVIQQLVTWVGDVVRFFGGEMPTFDAPKGKTQDNTGAAARQASTTTSSAVLQKARENAFSLGWGPGKPEEQTAKHTSTMTINLEKLIGIVKNFVDNAGELMISAGKTALDWFWKILHDVLVKMPLEAAEKLWKFFQEFLSHLPGGKFITGGSGEKPGAAGEKEGGKLRPPAWLSPAGWAAGQVGDAIFG